MTCRRRPRSKSGFKTKRASARRTAWFGNGPSGERGRANLPISATTTPICSALSARRAASARRSRCPMPTPKRCNSTLDEISRHVAKGAHAVLLLDRAGWHTTAKLDVPKNITPIFLPSRAPELNPVENIWQYLRANWLSNRVFENVDAIIDAACEAWRKLIAQPETITSIGMRDWAHVGQI